MKEYDHWRYIEMARGPEGNPELQREPPYCFRLAVPALARGLMRMGLAENAAFYLITNAALFGFLLLLWLHLRDLGFSPPLRVTGLLVTGLTQGAVRWFEYQYWMSDPVALFLVMLAFFLVERGQSAALFGTSVVAAFVRETYVLVYPYLFLRELRLGRRFSAASPDSRGGRTAVRDPRGDPHARQTRPARRLRVGDRRQHDVRLDHVLDNQPYVVTLGAFGVLVPLVLLLPARLPGLARRHFDRGSSLLGLRHARDLEQQRAAARLRAAGPRSRGALVPAGLPAGDPPARPAGLAAVAALQLLFWAGQRWAEIGSSVYQQINWTTVAAMAGEWLAARATL